MNFIAVPFLFGQMKTDFILQNEIRLKLIDNSSPPAHFKGALHLLRKNDGGLAKGESVSCCLTLNTFADSIPSDRFSGISDSTRPKDSTFTTKPATMKKFKMKKNPLVAVLLSAAVPGAGQFYNQSYWKVPVIAGFAGYFVYEYIVEDKKFRDYRDQYAASQTTQFPEGNDNLKALREFYRSQRNNFTWYFLITYFINLVDAYVDAHLFDFNVKDEKITSSGLVDRKMNLSIHIPLK